MDYVTLGAIFTVLMIVLSVVRSIRAQRQREQAMLQTLADAGLPPSGEVTEEEMDRICAFFGVERPE